MNREKLKRIKKANPRFYQEFVTHFLTNPLTLQGFDNDFYRALQAITGITVGVDKSDPIHLKLFKSYKGVPDLDLGTYDNNEEAFDFIVAALRNLHFVSKLRTRVP